MRSILQKRSLRFVFAANVISMLGSGMNSAAVAWTILQRTHSEMALGTFAALQTIPAMLMLPFTGVIIDREDFARADRARGRFDDGLYRTGGVGYNRLVAERIVGVLGHQPSLVLVFP